jgi:hypothetical protein
LRAAQRLRVASGETIQRDRTTPFALVCLEAVPWSNASRRRIIIIIIHRIGLDNIGVIRLDSFLLRPMYESH